MPELQQLLQDSLTLMTRAEGRRRSALQRAAAYLQPFESELQQLDQMGPRQRLWMQASVFRYFRYDPAIKNCSSQSAL